MDMWMIWVIAAILFAIIEIYTPSFFIIWFSAGSLAACVTSLMTENEIVQFSIFIVVTLLLIIFSRPITQRFKGNHFVSNTDKLINKTGVVTSEIKPLNDNGRIEIMGQSWKATSANENETIAVGDAVKVISIDGVTLTVTKN